MTLWGGDLSGVLGGGKWPRAFDRRGLGPSTLMTNTTKSTKALLTRLTKAGYRPRSYSGRGMYGRVCVGVTLDRFEELTVGARTATWDSMGLGRIAYWPGHTWPAGMNDVGEEADAEGAE